MPDIDTIIAYENGELDEGEFVAFFADLVRTGLAWTLQGSYGRTARDLIEAGYITRDGQVAGGGNDPEEN
ncbi:MAG TPA: hypothetical protein VF062_22400 [Candidatus Limnocylindrales bacterium]